MRQIVQGTLALLCIVFAGPDAASDERRHEMVVVTASAAPSEVGEVGRAVTVLERSAIERFAVHSLADLLRLAPHLRVAGRGEHGAQTDFSLRGATFGQTLVMVDGVRMNDAQTGHHNGDIPVPLDDVERVEILYGPSSSLHGADAFGGTIHVLTRRERPRGSLRVATGSFGFVDGSASGRLGNETTRLDLTLSGRRSDGFTAHRDFQGWEARADASFGAGTRASFSHLDKEFGAVDLELAQSFFAHYERSLLVTTPIMETSEMVRNTEEFNQLFDCRSEVREGTLDILRNAWETARQRTAAIRPDGAAT